MKRNKKVHRYLIFLCLVIVFSIELPIFITGLTCRPLPGDVIIVLGAKLIEEKPSAMLRLRLDEALRLYKNNYAPTIIVSGAQGPDETTSEAVAMKAYLVAHGIPSEKIHIEDKSFNTLQNLHNSHAIMQQFGYRNAIIVSNLSHMHRALILAQSIGMNATGSAAPMANNVYLNTKQYLREGAAVAVLITTGK